MWATLPILPPRASTSLLDQDEYFFPNHPAHHSYDMIFYFYYDHIIYTYMKEVIIKSNLPALFERLVFNKPIAEYTCAIIDKRGYSKYLHISDKKVEIRLLPS